MTPVGDLEVKTQQRVISIFCDRLGYRYLGNWHEREDNRNIEPALLKRFLARQGQSTTLIAKALDKLEKAAALSTKPTARSTACCGTEPRSAPGSASTPSRSP